VYLIGNPLVQLSTTAGIIFGLAFVAFAWSGLVDRSDGRNHGFERVGRLLGSLYIVLGGWMLHYLPFAFVARDCFLT
jgi:dolichyl-phosphate-mannose--protein O-mannosyl transferase